MVSRRPRQQAWKQASRGESGRETVESVVERVVVVVVSRIARLLLLLLSVSRNSEVGSIGNETMGCE